MRCSIKLAMVSQTKLSKCKAVSFSVVYDGLSCLRTIVVGRKGQVEAANSIPQGHSVSLPSWCAGLLGSNLGHSASDTGCGWKIHTSVSSPTSDSQDVPLLFSHGPKRNNNYIA